MWRKYCVGEGSIVLEIEQSTLHYSLFFLYIYLHSKTLITEDFISPRIIFRQGK